MEEYDTERSVDKKDYALTTFHVLCDCKTGVIVNGEITPRDVVDSYSRYKKKEFHTRKKHFFTSLPRSHPLLLLDR